MSIKQQKHLRAACRCGKVAFETVGAPILSTSCHCASCREAGHQFEALPEATPVSDVHGGTQFLLYRKDRVRCVKGEEYLKEFRLKPDSPTRRVLTTCCNSPMFLEFQNGHWLSMYRDRFSAAEAPPVDMRVMTRDRPAGVELPDDMPNYATHSGKFMWKLLSAWAAMGFRAPKITYVKAS